MFGRNLQTYNLPRSSVASAGFVAIITVNGVPTAVGRRGALLTLNESEQFH